MKILVTGSDGQLGRALRAEFEKEKVIALSHRDLPIENLERVRAALRADVPDVIVNCAAMTDVDGCELDPKAAYRVNACGPRNLALTSNDLNVLLVHISTDYVFDGLKKTPYHEDDQPNPLSLYGRSKLAGEEAVRECNPRHLIIRTSWVYHSAGKNLLKAMLARAKDPDVGVVADQSGSPTYAPFLARAIHQLILSGAYGLFHVAGGGGATRYEIVRFMYGLLKLKSIVHPISYREFKRPAARPAWSVLTTRQEPRIELPPWKEGVKAFLKEIE